MKTENKGNINEGLVVKIFTPNDQTVEDTEILSNEIYRLRDEFLTKHPELEQVCEEITYKNVDKINASFRTFVSFMTGAFVFRKKDN